MLARLRDMKHPRECARVARERRSSHRVHRQHRTLVHAITVAVRRFQHAARGSVDETHVIPIGKLTRNLPRILGKNALVDFAQYRLAAASPGVFAYRFVLEGTPSARDIVHLPVGHDQ